MKVKTVHTVWVWFLCFGMCHCMLFNVQRRYSGSITPHQPRVCIDQDVMFKCQLEEKPEPGKELHFAKKIPPNAYVIVNESDVIREDRRSANFTLRVIRPAAYMNVKCYYGQRDDVNNEFLRISEPVLFPVYSMPKTVQQFTCIVYNYEEMICSWEYGMEFAMDVKPNVTLEWKIAGDYEWHNCPNLAKNKTQCNWYQWTDGELDIRITLEQHCYANVTSDFTINTLLLVKPRPVTKLTSLVINTTCVRLQWIVSDIPITYFSHDYRIQISSVWSTTEVIKSDLQNGNITDGLLVTTLCDLEEDTRYTFTVAQKPKRDGFWSEGLTTVVTTFKDVPSTSPSLISGGYFWDPADCAGGGKMRNVCLLWKRIEKIDQNGDMKGIEAKFTPIGSQVPEEYKDLSEDTTYACAWLSCDITYNVAVNARNEIGKSKVVSTVLVQKWLPNITQPTFIVEMARNQTRSLSSVYVTFDLPPKEITDVYVAWCVNSMGQCANDGQVEWMRLSPNDTTTLFLSESPEKYLYSVSMANNDVSFGSHWEHCIYTKDEAPSLAPQNVIVTTGPEDNTLVTTWEKLGCKSGEPLTVAYRVKYCHINSGKCSIKEVPFTTSRVVLQKLVEQEEYTVQIQRIAAQNLSGPYSHTVSGTPENNSLKLHDIIGIACGALALIIMASIGCVFVVRLLRKRTTRWKEKVGGVQLPEHFAPDLTIDVHKTLPKLDVRKLSADSGVPPTPSPLLMDGSSITWSDIT